MQRSDVIMLQILFQLFTLWYIMVYPGILAILRFLAWLQMVIGERDLRSACES